MLRYALATTLSLQSCIGGTRRLFERTQQAIMRMPLIRSHAVYRIAVHSNEVYQRWSGLNNVVVMMSSRSVDATPLSAPRRGPQADLGQCAACCAEPESTRSLALAPSLALRRTSRPHSRARLLRKCIALNGEFAATCRDYIATAV